MRTGRVLFSGVLGVLIALMLLPFDGRAQDQGAGDADGTTAGAVAVDPVARDDEIAERIARILKATGWYDEIRVEVRDGVVFLDGTADSADRKTWARDLAAKTQDVVAVVNRLVVAPDANWTFQPALTELLSLARTGFASLPLIALALVILPLAFYAAVLVTRLMEWLLESRVEAPFLRSLVARSVAVPVFLIGLYIVLQVAGLTQLALSLLGGAGVVGIIVGFAFRDIAENFLASILLSVRRPFRRGDFIRVGEHEGVVQSMNTRSTLLLSIEGNHIQIPNAAVFKSIIVNYSSAPARREFLDVGIGYDVSVADAQQIVLNVLLAHEAVLDEPEEPLVLVESLGSATVNLRAYFWFDGNAYSVHKVRSALLRLVKKALTENGVSMPDEAREIIFPQGVPVFGMGGEKGTASPAAPTMLGPGQVLSQSEPARESAAAATSSEGDLESEAQSLQKHAATADLPGGTSDLLGEEDRSKSEAN